MLLKLKHQLNMQVLKNKDSFMYKALVKLNLLLFHFSEREQKRKFGINNKETTFYVIRVRGYEEGLLSIFNKVMQEIQYAKEKGYLPIVDIENYKTQYNDAQKVNGTYNMWEYYFEQPIKTSLEEVYSSHNVILSGWSFLKKDRCKDYVFNHDYSDFLNIERKLFIKENIQIKEEVLINAQDFENIMFEEGVLGVFLRGTDYTGLKPKGHNIQPPVQDVINKTKEYVEKYNIRRIFLVTEDYSVYAQFKNVFGRLVFCSDDDYITEYEPKDYVAYYNNTNKTNYEKGLNYLVRLILLSKCDYLITSLTNGSLFTLAIKKEEYKDKYVFNLGKY